MNIKELRLDCAIKQKKGLHFILASVAIWCAVLFIHLTSLPILTKKLFTFFCTAPLMVIAIIFGAHLLPYSWLYKSKSYMVFSIAVPILSLIIGLNFQPYILAGMLVVIEILFSLCLIVENRSVKLGLKYNNV